MKRRLLTAFITITILMVTTPFALATDYKIKVVVPDGKKSKEADAVLRINKETFEVLIEKEKFEANNKKLAFSDLKTADYSYSKKPVLSTGGAIATAILVGVFVLPFLFMKKKNHWLTVQTEDQFAVMKLDKNNFRAIIAEFETHGVEVKEVFEEDKKDKDKNDKDVKMKTGTSDDDTDSDTR